MPATSALHKQLLVLWRYRETPRGGNMPFAVLCCSLHPSLSSSSIAPVHLCNLTNDCSAAVSLPCIIYHEPQRGKQEREAKRDKGWKRKKFFIHAGGKAEKEQQCYPEGENENKEKIWQRCRHCETSMCCKGSVKGKGENRLEGTRRPILLITALIWWETLTALDGNNTQELPLYFCLPPRMGGDIPLKTE